jgi:multicomponent Na+:H+ antiporter subunit D
MLLLPSIIIIPLASAFLIPVFGKKVKPAGSLLTCAAALCLVVASFLVASFVMAHKVIVHKVGNWMPPSGITLVADSLTAFMLITVNVVIFMVALYSTGYVKKYTDQWKFWSLFSLMSAGINGVLVAGDIFNLYVFLEIAAMAGYFLVAFGTKPHELEASFKYAVMGVVASIFILLGIGFLYSYVSTVNMADMASVIASKGPSRPLEFVSILFLMGFGLKASLVPFHAWLPYAHSSAPAPVSAMLSGVSIKVLGIYAIVRIFFNVFLITPAVSHILVVLAVMSMITGSILAFGQSDIKRLYAYSTISQVGYIALGLGVGTPLAVFASLFHLFNHSVFKSLLFLTSGTIEKIAGTRNLNKIRGMVVKSPVTGYASLAGALSICGMPPLGGFWSKLLIILACIQADRPVLALIAVAISILTLAYYFKALTPALFGKEEGAEMPDVRAKKRPSLIMAIPVIILALITVTSVAMLLPNAGNALLRNAADVLTNGKDYAIIVMGALK